MLDGSHYFECKCGSSEHTVRFVLDEEENELYVDIFLNQYRNIFQRIWVAIKYVFGYECKNVHWDGWILRDNDVVRLESLLKRIKIE